MNSTPSLFRVARRSVLSVAVMAAVLVGLATTTSVQAQASKKGEKAAASLKALAKEVEAGDKQIGVVTAALNQLVNKPNEDLKKPYKQFEKGVKKLESITASARKRQVGLKQEKDAYLQAWDQEIAKISNEDIKSRSAERKQKVTDELAKLSDLSSKLSESYKAFEQNLIDIRSALSADLTPGGVQAVAPVANKARENAVSVRDNLKSLSAELETLGFAMSSKAQKP